MPVEISCKQMQRHRVIFSSSALLSVPIVYPSISICIPHVPQESGTTDQAPRTQNGGQETAKVHLRQLLESLASDYLTMQHFPRETTFNKNSLLILRLYFPELESPDVKLTGFLILYKSMPWNLVFTRIEMGPYCHMARHGLILKHGEAIWLRMTSRPL